MLVQFLKYNIVGIANTVTGVTIIVTLMSMGMSATLSNVIGYSIGAFFSYYLNSRYTFQNTIHSKNKMMKFFMVLGMAYILNFITLQSLLGEINAYVAQGIAAIVYTLSSFLFMRVIVFRTTE